MRTYLLVASIALAGCSTGGTRSPSPLVVGAGSGPAPKTSDPTAAGFAVYAVPERGHLVLRRSPGSVGSVRPSGTDKELLRLSLTENAMRVLGAPGVEGLALDPSKKKGILTAVVHASAPHMPATDLWLVDIEAGGGRRLTDDGSGYSNVAFSPHGSSIAYTSQEGSVITFEGSGERRFTLYAQALPTGKRRKLFSERLTDHSPLPLSKVEWTPDSKAILYLASEPAGLWYIPIGSGARRRLSDLPERVFPSHNIVVWWEDKSSSVVVRRLPKDYVWGTASLENVGQTYRFSLPDYPFGLTMSPNGRYLAGKGDATVMRNGKKTWSHLVFVLDLEHQQASALLAPERDASYRVDDDGAIILRANRFDGTQVKWLQTRTPIIAKGNEIFWKRPVDAEWILLAEYSAPGHQLLYP